MVSTMDRWSKGDTIFRSTDAAKTWTEIGSKSSRDWSLSPYLTFGGSSARFGWWVGALAVDPFDPNHAMYGTGATIWSTNDLTNADTGRGTHWSVGARGLEETAVVSLVSPPSGAHLISGLGDIGGFRHDNLNVSPRTGMFTNPVFTTTECIDFAELNPMVVARVGRGNGGANGAYSTDNGITWQPFLSAPSGTPSSGTIAVSSDGKSMVWCPQGATAASSMDNGRTWVACNGLPTGRASVVSDRLRPGTYYVISGQDLYLSADGGTDFSRVSTLPPGTRHLLSVPGIAGDLWLTCGDNGVYHSTDGGVSFAPIGHVYDAERIGFGKAKPGSVYPAIYLTGQTADGASGVFRSDDQGINWIRINDNQHQYGYSGQTVTGDPRVYGRVYMGSNGRGILYGDPVSIAHH